MNLSGADIRLKGFTLLELLVGMIVSAIVLGAAFSAYHIIARQTMAYQEKTGTNEDLSLFHCRLMCDFQNAETTVVASPFELHLKGVVYLFHDTYVLRKNNEHIDTFFVTITSCEGFVQGEQNVDPEVGIDQVRLKMISGKHEEEIILLKSGDAKSALSIPRL
jgi:prepilin-type N-terminal cleavage/methylation domain-containing protein